MPYAYIMCSIVVSPSIGKRKFAESLQCSSNKEVEVGLSYLPKWRKYRIAKHRQKVKKINRRSLPQYTFREIAFQ